MKARCTGVRDRTRSSYWTTFVTTILLLIGAGHQQQVTGQAKEGTLEGLRALYHQAVTDRSAIDKGNQEIGRIRGSETIQSGSLTDVSVTAYEGALTLLRAKYAVWPPTRIQHVRRGLATLDTVVGAHPDHMEGRYLRLVSCFHLPSFLGRGRTAREDMAFLAQRLPAARGDLPPDLYRNMVGFVLKNGEVAPSTRTALERSLQ